MKYAWIDNHRQTYSTTMMCELLSVSRSGLNAARVRARHRSARSTTSNWSSRFGMDIAGIEGGTAGDG